MTGTVSEKMHWLQQQLANVPPPDVIVHLGAGLCRELDLWRASGARRIVLVEPHPELLPELQRRIRPGDSAAILPLAVSADAGREPMHLLNFALLSSLRPPTDLFRILPGLTQTDRAMVETISVDQLIGNLDLNGDGEHWLVIDTPGVEAAILDQLQSSGRLHAFARIFLSAGVEPMYEDSESVAALLERLETLGYANAGRPDNSDSDWPRYHLVLDRLALECSKLRHELEQAEERAGQEAERARQLAAELEASKKALTALQESSTTRTRELEAYWKEAEQAKNEAEEQGKASLAEAQNAHQSEVQALKRQLAEVQEAHGLELAARENELAALRESSSSRVEGLEAALAEQRGKAEQVESLTRQLSAVEKQAQQHQAQLDKAQSDLSLALRLQMLRENDLKELQTRYGEVLTIKDEQQDLLTQLHHRLSRAAEYLQLVHARKDDEGLPEELLEALTGKDEKSA